MTAMERPGKRFVWRALTILAARSALTAALADGADASEMVGSIAFERGRLKRVGAFEAPAPGDSGAIIGWIKGKKAEGLGYDEYPGCPYDSDWEAKLSK